MLRSKEAYILEIGSHKLRLLVAKRMYTDSYSVEVSHQVPYDGFVNGHWVSDSNVSEAIKQLMTKCKESLGKVKKLYVGVPAEFCEAKAVYSLLNSIKQRKVEESDVQALYAMVNPFDSSKYTVIDKSPIYYRPDSGGCIVEILGTPTKRLEGYLSFIAVENSFITQLNSILKNLGVQEIEYLSSIRCEMLGLFDTTQRDNGVMLVDCGYRSTTVSVMVGDGIRYMRSFSRGKGHLIAWLAKGLNTDFSIAARLFEKVDLSYIPSPDTAYSVESENGIVRFPCQKIISMVDDCVGVIGTLITKSIQMCEDSKIAKLTINLTGDGLSSLRGIEGCLEKKTGRSVRQVLPYQIPNYKNPEYSRVVGLAVYALSQNKKNTLF